MHHLLRLPWLRYCAVLPWSSVFGVDVDVEQLQLQKLAIAVCSLGLAWGTYVVFIHILCSNVTSDTLSTGQQCFAM